MPDETNNTEQTNESVVEVSEQELADLGDFLAQVQIVLIGHEQRIGVLETAVFENQEDSLAGLSDEGDSGSADGSAEDAGTDGPVDSGESSLPGSD